MNTPDSQKIIIRFYEAIDELIKEGRLKNFASFIRRYDLSQTNFYKSKGQPERDIFQPAWLSYVVNDYGVSANWLLSGTGKPLKKFTQKLQHAD